MSAKPTVFFDGECNLCNRFINILLTLDREGVFLLASLQGETAKNLKLYELATDSIVVVIGEKTYLQSNAVLAIARHLGLPWSLLGVFSLVPRSLRDLIYRWIARNRYQWFGRRECRLPTPEERARFLP